MGYAARLIFKNFVIFSIMGFIYFGMEFVFRGTLFYEVVAIGGLCGLSIGYINKFLPWDTSILLQGFIGMIIVVTIEFISGCILNLWLRLNIWDYSSELFNLNGQICLKYALLWYLMSLFAIYLDDLLRWILFGEEKPHYKIL